MPDFYVRKAPFGSNQFSAVLPAGGQLFFSYDTAVAAFIAGKWYRTSKKWSQTTTKHIKGFVGYHDVEVRPQPFFDALGCGFWPNEMNTTVVLGIFSEVTGSLIASVKVTAPGFMLSVACDDAAHAWAEREGACTRNLHWEVVDE